MPGNTAHNQDGYQQPVDVVNGSTFEGVPYQIALETIAFDHGWSAHLRKGRMLGNDPLAVAVKVFGGMLDSVKEKLLIRELRFAGQVALSHPSILGFLGTANIGEQTAIVSLYMGNGNMMAYMKANRGCDKKKLILQVAEAVEFLHDEKSLVHGDIKCTNVLISDFGNALLADFGLATFAEKSQFTTATMTAIRQMNTLHFAAPELLLGEGTTTLSKTRQSDVYAFGMLIFEAVLEQPPWGMKNDFAVMKAICSSEHPERPRLDGEFISISYHWWQICCDCWCLDPSRRPLIRRVLSDMRNTDPVRRVNRVLPFQEHMVSAQYTPDGCTLFALTYDGSIVLFDIATRHVRYFLSGFEDGDGDGFSTMTISPDGRQIACCFQQLILVLDAASAVQVTSMAHSEEIPYLITYSRDGTRLASGASDGTVHMWDTATGAANGQLLEGHSPHHRLSGLSFSPDGICLASASEDGTICIWDSMACTPMATLQLGDSSSIFSMEFSPLGTHIASGDDAGNVFIWDVRERRIAHTFELTEWGASRHVAFSPSGRYIASGFECGEIGIWDIQDGSQVGDTLDGPFGNVHFVAFSPDGKSLVSVADDWKVRVWDLFE